MCMEGDVELGYLGICAGGVCERFKTQRAYLVSCSQKKTTWEFYEKPF